MCLWIISTYNIYLGVPAEVARQIAACAEQLPGGEAALLGEVPVVARHRHALVRQPRRVAVTQRAENVPANKGVFYLFYGIMTEEGQKIQKQHLI